MDILRPFFFLGFFVLTFINSYAASYTWAGGTSTAWNNSSNWTPNSGFPGTGDDVTINGTGTFQPILNAALSIGNLTVSGGTLDLNANTLTVSGTPFFSGGAINNGTVAISSSGTCTFGATTFGAVVNGVAAEVLFNGATFSNTLTIDKTGSGNNAGSGNTTFGSTTTISNSGTGILYLASTTRDIFNGAVTFTNTGSGVINVAYNGTNTQFNNNVIVNSTAGSGVFFGQSSGTSTLASGRTITTGGTGFTSGSLKLRNFTQSGSTAQSLTLTSAGALYLQTGTTFNGNFTCVSPDLFLNGAVFNGINSITKNGANSNNNIGGNTFSGTTTITNSGAGDLILGYTNPDIFGDLTVNNTGTNDIYLAYNSSGNQFNGTTVFNAAGSGTTNYIEVAYKTGSSATFTGIVTANNIGTSVYYNMIRFSLDGSTSFSSDIYINSTVPTTDSLGIYFGYRQPNTGSLTLADTKRILVGATGFSSGNLYIYNLNQVSNTPQTLTMTGASKLVFGAGTTFNADLTTSSPNLYLNGATFNGNCNFTKTGSVFNSSDGGNVFNGTVTITNSGTNYILLANVTRDIFNADVTFTNTNTSLIYPAFKGGNTLFNGNVYVNSTLGSGVYFGQSTGTATLASGKTITVGASGFSKGALKLRNFTQTGSTAQNITLTGTAAAYYETGTTFNGNLTSVSPQLYLNGSTFNGVNSFTKNGATDNLSNGGCVYNGVTTITVSGANYLALGNTSADVYNEDVTFVQSSTGAIMPSYNTACVYYKNITVNSGSVIVFGSGTSGSTLITGANAQSISKSGSANPTLTRLTMDKSSNSLTLGTPIVVANLLTMTSGNINTTSTNSLTLSNAATTTIGSSTSFVDGPLNYIMSFSGSRTLNFPIGKGSDHRPFSLSLTHSTATSYTYNAEVFNESAHAFGWSKPATVNAVSSIHYWTINRYTTGTTTSVPSTDLSGNQQIQIYFGTNDQVNDGGYLTIVKNTAGAPTSWIDIGGTGAPVYTDGSFLTGSITSTSTPTAFNSFSSFALGNRPGGLNPLPVQLISFEAQCENENINFEWITGSEKENQFFTIEKSTDGTSFTELGKVEGGGNSLSLRKYSYSSKRESDQTLYYRLKDTDINGRSSIIGTITSQGCVTVKELAFDLFPNPSQGDFSIRIEGTANRSIELKIYNSIGELVGTENILTEATVYENSVNLKKKLSQGVYFVTLSAEKEIFRKKLIVY